MRYCVVVRYSRALYKINYIKRMAQNNENTNEENSAGSENAAGPSKRGFASMDEDKQREIASKGGKSAHEKGTAHEFTSEEAKRAGQKGGQARQGTNALNEAGPSDLSHLTDDFDR